MSKAEVVWQKFQGITVDREIDLMARYPKTRRDIISAVREAMTEDEREISRKFGWEYFDGPRKFGLGGYYYDPKWFKPVVEDMILHYQLTNGCSVLDVGCGKGFMVKDFREALPGSRVTGIDISEYCIDNAIVPGLTLGSCDDLPYKRDEFDLVVSIATIHNLDLDGVKNSLREIARVSAAHAYIKVNGYRTEEEREALAKWNIVAKTILHVDDWRLLFDEVGYWGDYSFFVP